MTIVEEGKRLAELPYKKRNKNREYLPSRTELLLEEFCRSFGTELLPAYVDLYNGVKLIRLSQPVNVRNEKNDQNFVLAAQYTRFSPLFHPGYMNKVIAIYDEAVYRRPYGSVADNTDRVSKVSREIEKKIKENSRVLDAFQQVTNNTFIPNVPILRWPKTLYFSAFAVDKPIDKLTPFLIHEYGQIHRNPPDVHVAFHREPFFARRNLYREDTGGIFDTLTFDFPALYNKHERAFEAAKSLYHLSNPHHKEYIYRPERDVGLLGHPRPISVELHSSIDVYTTLAFISTYLRYLCLGRRI